MPPSLATLPYLPEMTPLLKILIGCYKLVIAYLAKDPFDLFLINNLSTGGILFGPCSTALSMLCTT